jgi:hypothetical protein
MNLAAEKLEELAEERGFLHRNQIRIQVSRRVLNPSCHHAVNFSRCKHVWQVFVCKLAYNSFIILLLCDHIC